MVIIHVGNCFLFTFFTIRKKVIKWSRLVKSLPLHVRLTELFFSFKMWEYHQYFNLPCVSIDSVPSRSLHVSFRASVNGSLGVFFLIYAGKVVFRSKFNWHNYHYLFVFFTTHPSGERMSIGYFPLFIVRSSSILYVSKDSVHLFLVKKEGCLWILVSNLKFLFEISTACRSSFIAVLLNMCVISYHTIHKYI